MDTQTVRVVYVYWLGSRVAACADDEGVVRVWDSVAGHYTTCHSLTRRQIQHVRRSRSALAAVDGGAE
jgi:hypothetical protein